MLANIPQFVEYIIVAALMFAFAATYMKLASKYGIVDNPTHRSSHVRRTVTGGGLVFVAAILLYLFSKGTLMPYYLAGLTILTVVSYADDIRAISVYPRFVIQIIAATLLLSQIELDIPLNFDELPSFHWTYSVVMVVVIVGIFNLFNFMDGINGMLGITGFVLFVTLLLVNNAVPGRHFIDNDYLIYTLLALGIFLFYNLRKQAHCFAGDVGAIVLAFISVYAVARLIAETENFIYIFLFAPYAIEAGYTIIQRIFLRQNIFQPHRIHLFQLLCNELRFSHTKISIVYGICQMLINVCIMLVNVLHFSLMAQLLTIGTVYAVLSGLYIYWKWKIMVEQKIIK